MLGSLSNEQAKLIVDSQDGANQIPNTNDQTGNNGVQTFIQFHAKSAYTLSNHSKVKIKNNDELIMDKLNEIVSDENTICNGPTLKQNLENIINSLNYDLLKNTICGSMSKIEFRDKFAESCPELSLEKPWWPLIPPKQFLNDNLNLIHDYLSCNLNCIRPLLKFMRHSGSFDSIVFINQFTTLVNSLESVDFKTEFDVLEETFSSKTDSHNVIDEMLSQDKYSPQILKSILS